jgi:hypothetical protein
LSGKEELEQRLGVTFKWKELPPELQENLQDGYDNRHLLATLQVLMEDVKEEIWALDSAIMMAVALIICFVFAGAYIFMIHGPLSDDYAVLLGIYTFEIVAVIGGFFYSYRKRVNNMVRLARIRKAQERLRREIADENEVLRRASGLNQI